MLVESVQEASLSNPKDYWTGLVGRYVLHLGFWSSWIVFPRVCVVCGFEFVSEKI